MKYQSKFTIENPPLLVAWISLTFDTPLSENNVSAMREKVNEMGYSSSARHEQARLIDGNKVSSGVDVWTSEGKSRLVGISKHELYFVAAKPRFEDLMADLRSTISPLLTDSIIVQELQMTYYNVFETDGKLTPLLLREFQGPPATKLHEHRMFYLIRGHQPVGTISSLSVNFTHGDAYRPSIRDSEKGLEYFLALKPEFETNENVNCYGLKLVARQASVSISAVEQAAITLKGIVDDLFLESITEEARKKWKINYTS